MPPWMNEFCVLYIEGHEWFVAQLSGVGIDELDEPFSPLPIAPVDPERKCLSSSSPLSSSVDEDGFPEEILVCERGRLKLRVISFVSFGLCDPDPILEEKDGLSEEDIG